MYLVVSCLEKQRTFIQTKVYYKYFYSVWIETTHKPSKIAATKNFFSSVYVIDFIDKNCFDECFLFHLITGRHFFIKVCFHFEIFSTAILLVSLKQVFWKMSVFHARISTITVHFYYQSPPKKLSYFTS